MRAHTPADSWPLYLDVKGRWKTELTCKFDSHLTSFCLSPLFIQAVTLEWKQTTSGAIHMASLVSEISCKLIHKPRPFQHADCWSCHHKFDLEFIFWQKQWYSCSVCHTLIIVLGCSRLLCLCPYGFKNPQRRSGIHFGLQNPRSIIPKGLWLLCNVPIPWLLKNH